MAEVWVVNASPLILLGKIGQIGLLSRLCSKLVVPRGVAEELRRGQPSDPARRWLHAEGMLLVKEVTALSPAIAGRDLGRGESHVLQLCQELPGSEAILDDPAGRRLALNLGIPFRGTIGVILLAKSKDLVPVARPLLEGIRAAGLRVDQELFERALNLAGE
ncbi:MAG: DUF3368 domain-containing protein [Planctomycetes bacterium]|nr:DUF3368 domain-containing protein [Planctomycetota bacterium]